MIPPVTITVPFSITCRSDISLPLFPLKPLQVTTCAAFLMMMLPMVVPFFFCFPFSPSQDSQYQKDTILDAGEVQSL